MHTLFGRPQHIVIDDDDDDHYIELEETPGHELLTSVHQLNGWSGFVCRRWLL